MNSLVFDMDGTIIDFAKGDLVNGLNNMWDSNDYKDLKPWSRLFQMEFCRKVSLFKDKYSVRVISGIPDDVDHNFAVKGYSEYYNKVIYYKRKTILKYYRDLFDSVDFIPRSGSKAILCDCKYGISDSILFDDMKRYCDEWESHGCSYMYVQNSYDVLLSLDLLWRRYDR